LIAKHPFTIPKSSQNYLARNQNYIIAAIVIIGSIIVILLLLDPNTMRADFKEDSIINIEENDQCKVVEKIYNDNKGWFGDKLLFQEAKDRLPLGGFVFKNCINPLWNK
jgi:hypothetical protein